MTTPARDTRRRSSAWRLPWIVAAFFVADVLGRAVGILLDVDLYVTEIAAIAILMVVVVATVARRAR